MAEPQGSLNGSTSAWKCVDANCGMELPGCLTGMRFCPRCSAALSLKKQIQQEKDISLDSKTNLNEGKEPTPITQSIAKDCVQGEGSPALAPAVADTAMKSTKDGINFPTQETGTPGDAKDQVGATLVTGNDKKDCDADKSAVVVAETSGSGDDTPKLNLPQVFGNTEVTQESGANNSVKSQKDQKDKQKTQAKQESGASNTVKTQKDQEDVEKKKCDQQRKKRKIEEQEEQRKERAEKRKIENQQREEEKLKRLKENQENRQRELKERQESGVQQKDRKQNAHQLTAVDTAHDSLLDDKKSGVTERKKNGGGGSQGDGGRKTEEVYKYTLHRLLN